jgi:hypothetical protein
VAATGALLYRAHRQHAIRYLWLLLVDFVRNNQEFDFEVTDEVQQAIDVILKKK